MGDHDIRTDPVTPALSGAEEKDFRLKLTLFGIAILIALVAAFAGYPTWENYMAQEESKLQLRAYVDVTALGPVVFKEGAQPRVRETIRNNGRTPAYADGIHSQVTVAEYPLRNKLAAADCPHDKGPQDKRQWFVGKLARTETARDQPFTAAEVEAIRSSKAAIYFHGRACYRDIFREDHHTDFCLLWKWDGGRFSPSLYCDAGNSLD